MVAAVFYASYQPSPPPPPRRIPALLRRFAALRRERSGAVDFSTVFPFWKDATPIELDLAMAIGQLVRQLDDVSGPLAHVVDGIEL